MADDTDQNDDRLGAVLDRLATVSAQLATVTAAPKPEPTAPVEPKTYTRDELAAAVEAGKITQSGADQIWDKQVEDRAAARAAATVRTEALVATLDSKIAEFEAAVPDIGVAGTDARKKVEAEFERMVKLGSPSSKATELLALERVFGSPERARTAGGEPVHTTHAESFGGGRPAPRRGGKEDENAAPSDLTAREKQHYQHQIDRGVVSGWKQVHEERQHRRAPIRAA